MSIQLANKSLRYLRGIIEDVLVKVDKFIFPNDLVILNIDKNIKMPLILGWPFLATTRAIIDVRDGKLVLRVGDEKVTFKICDSMKHSFEQEDTCYFLDAVDIIVYGSMQELLIMIHLNYTLFKVRRRS